MSLSIVLQQVEKEKRVKVNEEDKRRENDRTREQEREYFQALVLCVSEATDELKQPPVVASSTTEEN